MNTKYQLIFDELAKTFTKGFPFIKPFNLEVARCDHEETVLKFDMQEAYLGNFAQHIMHGGMTAAMMDNVGGLCMMAAYVVKANITTVEACQRHFSKACTIDLRIDYLRPGRGKFFTLKAVPVKVGRHIQFVRMEMRNDEDILIATASGTYMVYSDG